jgi:2-polyprenyl-3-methyl-5-hydroxy-6-metoxy-1,4-benzoquinol methylase
MNSNEISEKLKSLYANTSFFTQILVRLRPYICPFEIILGYVPKGSRVLDIGCGNGLVLNLLSAFKLIKSGIGVDVNVKSLDVASAVAKSNNLLGLFFTPKQPIEYFEAVLLIDVLHHIPVKIQKTFFLEATKALSNNGILIYKDMARKPKLCAFFNLLHDLIFARQLIHTVPLDLIIKWAEESGFIIVEIGKKRLGMYAHEWVVLRRP